MVFARKWPKNRGREAFTLIELPVVRKRRSSAFTLIELLTVMVIMGILMGLILGIAGFAKRALAEARTRAEIETLHNALMEHKLEKGFYPTNFSDLITAVTNWLPAGFDFEDSWDQDYEYQTNSAYSYTLYSKGPDAGNDADDIYSGK